MIDTSKMPQTFSLCLAKESECPLAENCMRSLVFRQQQESDKQDAYIKLVNPGCTSSGYGTEHCVAYKPNEKLRYARGMSHIFDEVKQTDYPKFRRLVVSCFSCETFFYRSQRGQRLISPEEQDRIAKVFKEMNIGTEPKFDAYVEEINWS